MMRKRDIFSKAVVVIAVAVLVVALPSAIVDTYQKRRIYLFSRQFLDELLLRFTGPGRPRFLPQRLIAIVLGCRSGLADARGGHPPFIYRLVTDSGNRKDLIDSGLSAVGNLVAMGIVLDAVAQFLIYGLVHPGRGGCRVRPRTDLFFPYAVSRGLANRISPLWQHRIQT
ncbi:hypothetical protein SAMN05446935_7474 [Burkholderia sp. YR290]|nr:hypothetical protein SAMN05446935_7474 [Burkholderia sp. YR290]